MSTNSECHVVKNDKTYFDFRRDENQLALSKRQGKEQDQQVFSCLEEDQCERRANRKTQASDFKPTQKKEELQEGDLIKAKGESKAFAN